MTVREIADLLQAECLCCPGECERVIHSAFASDMMSDVLAYVQEDTLLLTGLVNSQSVRTCEMLDVPCVVFVRGKDPLPDAIVKAKEIDLPVLKSPYSMFEACGLLYQAGIRGVNLTEDEA
ncbi:MAG: DRTGG domain-containing protein [Eubacteriales bacterium]|nr:DRTGG domain-containing protein [Eubacteriales bacterium]